MPLESPCPTDHDLQAFALGDVAGLRFEEIAEHVDACPRCETMLAALDGHADALLAELSCAVSAKAVQPVVPHEIINRALAAATSSGQGSHVSIDLGKRLARQLAEGPCQIGRFQLEAELGSGSFGYVFRAFDLELKRTVAVKIQRAGSFSTDEDMQRFVREARSAAQLQHPGIVSLFDAGETEDGVCFLVAEYVAGETLDSRIESGNVEQRAAVDLIAELAETLQYAHDHGVVHRDVKPSNIILDELGHPHITDFGMAKRMSEELTMTSDGHVIGTPAYMSPEQARGNSHQVDARSDVYSLGVILYELLTGERPFQGNRRLLMLQVLEDEPRPLRQLNNRVPKDLDTICLKAIAKSPSRRYDTAQELADDLRRFLAGEAIRARPVGYAERLWKWCRRYPLAVSLLVTVSAGAAFGFWYLSHLSSFFVQATALDSVRMEAEMLERINQYYSEVIVDRLDTKRVCVSQDYLKRVDAIPLPATFTIDSGQWISKGTSGMQVRMYSDHPWRSGGGPQGSFEHRALPALRKKVANGERDIEYHEFTIANQPPMVRYAKGQIMKESCVKCHNGSQKSPKRDWKVGDLVGVLAITRPLDRDIERTRSGLSGAFGLVAGMCAFLLSLSAAFILVTRLRNRNRFQTKLN